MLLVKESYNFVLSRTSITLGAEGGATEPVKVICNKEGSTWSAQITSSPVAAGMEPRFVLPDGQKVESLTSQPVETEFRLWIPGIDRQLQQQPVITVKVTLDNGLERDLTVTQRLPEMTRIYVQTIRNSYGSWATNDNTFTQPFGRWKSEMTDPSLFGPQSGYVYTPEPIYTNIQSLQQVVMTNGIAPKIFNMNGVETNHIDYAPYRNDPNTVFIVYVWEPSHQPFTYLGLQNDYKTAKPSTLRQETPRKIYLGDPQAMETELWKYIFEEGPFGAVNIDNVALYPQNYPNYMYCLTQWPDTFIPLMMVPSENGSDPAPNPNQALVGVDPTNRIIWLGHKDMFGTDYRASYIPNWDNDDNLKFLRNLIAWMVNVNNYGDGFNNRFKLYNQTRR